MAWLGPKDAAHDAAYGFPLALIRKSDRGLYWNDNIGSVRQACLPLGIVRDDIRPPY